MILRQRAVVNGLNGAGAAFLFRWFGWPASECRKVKPPKTKHGAGCAVCWHCGIRAAAGRCFGSHRRRKILVPAGAGRNREAATHQGLGPGGAGERRRARAAQWRPGCGDGVGGRPVVGARAARRRNWSVLAGWLAAVPMGDAPFDWGQDDGQFGWRCSVGWGLAVGRGRECGRWVQVVGATARERLLQILLS